MTLILMEKLQNNMNLVIVLYFKIHLNMDMDIGLDLVNIQENNMLDKKELFISYLV